MPAPTGLLFVDSFDHYNNVTLMKRKWLASNPDGSFVTGRSGSGQAWKANLVPTLPSITFGWNYPTVCVETAYKAVSFTNSVLIGGGLGLSVWGLDHVGDGRLTFGTHFGVNTGPLSGFVMALDTWYHIGVRLTITPNTYTYEIRINNSVLAAGVLTSSTFGVSTLGTTTIVPGNGGCSLDDFTITDGNFLGDANWVVIYPNGPGDATDWTPNPAVANWINTSEHSPDDFTSYNEAGSVADQDLYNMDDLGGSFTIVGAHALNCTTKSAAGVSSIEGSIKTNGSLIQEPEFFPSFGSWIYQRKGYQINPVTGVPWTFADINAIQRGALRIS